jgi:hypothetical protein
VQATKELYHLHNSFVKYTSQKIEHGICNEIRWNIPPNLFCYISSVAMDHAQKVDQMIST